ncbi:MAG: Omp28-related outer membrane protein [Bacteroidia bacterium]|nr:Omp28-related outer membrane protein [Bacteroidia bacterium]
MKNLFQQLWPLAILVVVVLSCKETPPFIDYSEPILLSKDTTYVTSDLPKNPLKNVLIEDISGVKCNNCPKAAEIAHDIQVKHDEGRVVVLTLHSNNFGVFTGPYSDSRDTFNTDEATLIVDNLMGSITGLPAGSIDRKVFSGQTQNIISAYESWETYVNIQLNEKPKAWIDLEVLKKEERTYITNIKSTFLEKDETPVFLSIFITESKIESKQKMPDNSYDNEFEHNSILRKAITTYSGLKLADNIDSVGRVFEKGLEIDIPSKYNIDNCSIVVLINKIDPNNKQVIQCVEYKL